MSRDADLYWLTGFLEGEGSFILNQRTGKAARSQSNDKYGAGGPTFNPRMSVANTDVHLLRKASIILCDNGIKFYWGFHRNTYRYKGKAVRKDYLSLSVEGYRSFMKLYELIGDKLCGSKKAQAEHIAEYVTMRLEELKSNRTASYEKGLWYFHELKRMRHDLVPPSTTKRVASTPLGW